jgi:hypothetical protein
MIFAFPIVIAGKWERKFPALQYVWNKDIQYACLIGEWWWNICYAINLYMCIVSIFIHRHHHKKTLKKKLISMIIIHTKLIMHSPHRWFRKPTFQKEEFEDAKGYSDKLSICHRKFIKLCYLHSSTSS